MFAPFQNRFWQRLSQSLFQTDKNTIEQFNGASPQTIYLYNRRDDKNNYERLKIGWSADLLSILTQASGTGTKRELYLEGSSAYGYVSIGHSAGVVIASGNGLKLSSSNNSINFTHNGTQFLNFAYWTIDGQTRSCITSEYTTHLAITPRPSYSDAATAKREVGIYGWTPFSGAVTNIVGGDVILKGGPGASGSSGAANGGNIVLVGGVSYGTGTKGIVTASRLRADGFSTAFAAKTADYTSTPDDGTLTFDASGAPRTNTLETAVGANGRIKVIAKIDSSANTVTIDPNASETINGSATLVLSAQWDKAVIQSDGANWIRIA